MEAETSIFLGCFNWMIPNLYIKSGSLTTHPLKIGSFRFQEYVYIPSPKLTDIAPEDPRLASMTFLFKGWPRFRGKLLVSVQ